MRTIVKKGIPCFREPLQIAPEQRRCPRQVYFGIDPTQFNILYFSEPPPGASPSASIRYTIENDWLLFRGEGLNKKNSAGHAQYPAHAQLLAERNEFSGPDFSMGDLYVYDMAQRAAREEKVQNPGNPGSWIKAGINHHLTFVATQISTLDVI